MVVTALSPVPSTQPTLPGVDWVVLASLVLIVIASLAVYLELVRRATHARERERLREWSRQSGFQLRRDAPLPPPVRAVAAALTVDVHLVGPHAALLRLTGGDGDRAERWHLAIVELPADSPTIALRPSSATRSFLDRFAIPVSPVSQDSLRFTLLCAEVLPARRLAGSIVRGILPPDIGLLRTGHHLLLDFSSRRFDPIELTRMVGLTKQVVLSMP